MENYEKTPLFDYESDEEGTGTLIGPAEFDAYVAHDVRRVIEDAVNRPDIQRVVIDLGRTSFLDSAGVQTLALFRANILAADKTYVIKNVQSVPRKVLEVSGMLQVLNIETEEA